MGTIFLLAFWVYLLGAIALGWRAGNRNDRQAISAICAAAAMSTFAHSTFDFPVAHILVALIDLALLAFMVRFAMRSERYWPIWFSGMLVVICSLAIVTAFVPLEVLRLDLAGGFWSMAAVTVMAAGLLADQRRQAC